MSFKEDIEALCRKAIRDKCDVVVRLPDAPQGWDDDKKQERVYQLVHLIKQNGCNLSRINETDFRIHAATESKDSLH